MNELLFSKKYYVRKLQKNDIDQIYSLCSKNHLYYQYCPPYVTRKSIESDMMTLPYNIDIKDKYYVGYFKNEKLIAVLDLIDGYPKKDIVFIGFFMIDINVQKNGIGSAIVNELIEYLTTLEYKKVRLGWINENPQAEQFWIKNDFCPIKEDRLVLANRRIK
ncbi:GNAT family N-acetyltransferase [uncultured Holdemanella sp.]|uniref:GNAT family N-acetyltransferase n=1 Tax=uncultured Holdemanella sp. TaxID=1763549 RepID=UPI0025ECA8F8|nr:GNAT family N-acetyltransferase [uncultured Holdemanella sp.]